MFFPCFYRAAAIFFAAEAALIAMEVADHPKWLGLLCFGVAVANLYWANQYEEDH